MLFHSRAKKTHFHKKGCALGLILKVRVFGTWKWPIHFLGVVFSAVADAYAKVESDSPVYDVSLARDWCHAECTT